jgi:hypothetical protein
MIDSGFVNLPRTLNAINSQGKILKFCFNNEGDFIIGLIKKEGSIVPSMLKRANVKSTTNPAGTSMDNYFMFMKLDPAKKTIYGVVVGAIDYGNVHAYWLDTRKIFMSIRLYSTAPTTVLTYHINDPDWVLISPYKESDSKYISIDLNHYDLSTHGADPFSMNLEIETKFRWISAIRIYPDRNVKTITSYQDPCS